MGWGGGCLLGYRALSATECAPLPPYICTLYILFLCVSSLVGCAKGHPLCPLEGSHTTPATDSLLALVQCPWCRARWQPAAKCEAALSGAALPRVKKAMCTSAITSAQPKTRGTSWRQRRCGTDNKRTRDDNRAVGYEKKPVPATSSCYTTPVPPPGERLLANGLSSYHQVRTMPSCPQDANRLW